MNLKLVTGKYSYISRFYSNDFQQQILPNWQRSEEKYQRHVDRIRNGTFGYDFALFDYVPWVTATYLKRSIVIISDVLDLPPQHIEVWFSMFALVHSKYSHGIELMINHSFWLILRAQLMMALILLSLVWFQWYKLFDYCFFRRFVLQETWGGNQTLKIGSW